MSRVGLVLGAGGLTGAAFHAGALSGLEEATGWDPRTADIVLGTSAGSVTGAALRAGMSAHDLAARNEGSPLSAEGSALMEQAGLSSHASSPSTQRISRRRFGPAAPQVLVALTRRPWAVRPTAVMAGLVPEGAVSTGEISDGVGALLGHRWPDKPFWVTAVRLHDGRLVVFGRGCEGRRGDDENDGRWSVAPGFAVAASCAIPGWFAPVVIGGERYVDGGAHSLTNLGELMNTQLDLVVVVSPMGRAGWRGYHGVARRAARLQLSLEAQRFRQRGIRVLALQPTRQDQLAMGPNPMDPSRRASTVRQARASTMTRMSRDDIKGSLEVLRAA
jgi:NTE family protein